MHICIHTYTGDGELDSQWLPLLPGCREYTGIEPTTANIHSLAKKIAATNDLIDVRRHYNITQPGV